MRTNMKTNLNELDCKALYEMVESETNKKCNSMDDIIFIMTDDLFKLRSDGYTLFDYMVIAGANAIYERATSIRRKCLYNENPMVFLKNKLNFFKEFLKNTICMRPDPYEYLDDNNDVILSIIDNGLYKGASK